MKNTGLLGPARADSINERSLTAKDTWHAKKCPKSPTIPRNLRCIHSGLLDRCRPLVVDGDAQHTKGHERTC